MTKPNCKSRRVKCSNCGGEHDAIELFSQHVKICTNCGYYNDWPLEEGQQPLISNNRIKEVTNHEHK